MAKFYDNSPNIPASSEENKSHFEYCKYFILDHWKLLLIGGISVLVLVISVFLITFFVVRGSFHCEKDNVMITTTAPNLITETTTLKIKTTGIAKTSTRIPFKATSTTLKPTTTATPQNLTCTNDFTMVQGKCWRWFNENSTREYADRKCKWWNNGATLVSIRNSEAGSAANYSSFGEGNNIGDENEKAPEVSARHSSYNCAPPKCPLKMFLLL
ncbi:hypothetical protein GCK72_019825 [Caenorhabditis remanei]|uniref:C-type lectin domain-containing protein n=1 Tax=Caenorhabditis remanei TaxID=31234 RepID=A0A6A5GFS8_CAERE|nr:hypothetical protein GCK72_019825 [Caenorhabditis remanei]KAF1753269.1 hypothetical protein GCK72_019825 [Caenorhabditis remanei]